jgi:hypothetical protein
VICILLAGGVPKPGEGLYELTRGAPKALVPVAGRPLGQWVAEALTVSRAVTGIIVVGLPDGSLKSPKIIAETGSHGDLLDNLLAGIALLEKLDRSGGRACVATSDAPLMTGTMIDWFIDSAAAGDVTGGVIRRELLEFACPDYPNTYWHLGDGDFTGADFAVFDPAIVRPDTSSRFGRFAAARKSALRMAWLVGPGLLVRYLAGRLTLREAEARLSKSVGLSVGLLDVPWPEMGLDLDLPEHLPALERTLLLK